MSRAGEIRSLSQVVKPDICIITNIGVSHIEYLGSREGILRAKCEIFENMQPNGLAVLNGDDDMLTALKLDFPVLYYGFGPGNDVRAEDVVADGLRGTLFTVRQGDIHFRAKTPLPGIHLVRTALAVSAVGLRLGLSPQEIAQGIESFKPSKMRMDIIRTNSRITLINDAYNAGPESMKAALDILAQAGGRRVCVLGDMLELGAYSRELHEDIGRYAGAVGIDLAVFVGENSRYAFEAFEDAKAINAGNTAMYFESKSELLKELHGLLHKRDTVLVKASRGMGFEDVVTEITR
jgi:UDP-N-acetylmuramoyl-tripeptide--D-alanyl-D-alanine ligase